MIYNVRVFLWHIVAELEYILYPWKEEDKTPSESTIIKYNLPEQSFDKSLHYDWLKSHEEKIARLQQEIIYLQNKIVEIENGQK
jgi:hypothetical protein